MKNLDYYESIASQKKITTLQAMADDSSQMLKRPDCWPSIIHYDKDVGINEIKANLINEDEFNLLQSFAFEISEQVMFPVNSVFLHGLGVVASAMTKSFNFKLYNKVKAVNLYVVTAQPPSTGKSGVNEYFSEPVALAFDDINRVNKVERLKLERHLAKVEKDLVKCSDPNEEDRLFIELQDVQNKIIDTPIYQYSTDDTTIEAAEVMAGQQKGMFNIISAEAESINVVVGSVYGDSKSKSNFGLLLKAWDNERHASNRIGRNGYHGEVKASIAVLAQYASVDTILETGASGRGLSERFLLLAEPNNLGNRKHTRGHVQISDGILNAYQQLIKNIVSEKYVVLSLCQLSTREINKLRDDIEPEMRDHGKYSNNMQRGFVGKIDKQIIKIASVLHVCEHWQENGDRKTEIDIKYIRWACQIFISLIDEYSKTASSLGYSGTVVEVEKIIDKFTELQSKNKRSIRIRELCQNTKNSKPFNIISNLSSHFKEKILPMLCKLNYCVVSRDIIYINPNL